MTDDIHKSNMYYQLDKRITELEKKLEVINDDNIRIFKDIQLSLKANFKRIEKLEAWKDKRITELEKYIRDHEVRLNLQREVLREVLLNVELKGITDVGKGRRRLELLGMLGYPFVFPRFELLDPLKVCL